MFVPWEEEMNFLVIRCFVAPCCLRGGEAGEGGG